MIPGKAYRTALLVAAGLAPASGWACAACYGQSDSPLAAGMNWGIMSLLGFILVVLGGVASFFVFLARRSAALDRANALPGPAQAEFETQVRSAKPPDFPGRGSRPPIAVRRRRLCRSLPRPGVVAVHGPRW